MVERAIYHGIPWYERADYPEVLALISDADFLPRGYDAWKRAAEEAEGKIIADGHVAIRVPLDPVQFRAWCEGSELEANASAQRIFVSDPANWPASQKH